MLIAFRTDANPQIGTGHVMRCLALAEALHANGARCYFLCRSQGLGEIGERIHAAGHQLLELPEGSPTAPSDSAPPHAHWLPHGEQQDAALCQQALATMPAIDWLVVDHYALSANWENALRPLAKKILVIDDLADRQHHCDLLLDANLATDEQRYASLLPAHCVTLLGPRYALLRPEFAAQRSAALSRPTPPQANRLLILFGGADRDNLTGKTVSLLAELGLKAEIDVVIGPLYPQRHALEQSLAQLPAARLHQAPDNIATLMSAADLAIGSPGTTSWERCALGLPCIAIGVADNQEAMAQMLARHGAHLYLGRQSSLNPATFAAAIRLLLENSGARVALRRQAANLCDGQGALRVARQMQSHNITMRLANNADAQRIHQWRNDPRVRQHAFDNAAIPLATHLAWFAATLANPARQLLLAEQDGAPIACVRFDLDLDQGSARISIFLDPDRLGQGLAVPVLRAAENWLLTQHPEIDCIQAEVLADNPASHQAFLGAGYRLNHSVYLRAPGSSTSPRPLQ